MHRCSYWLSTVTSELKSLLMSGIAAGRADLASRSTQILGIPGIVGIDTQRMARAGKRTKPLQQILGEREGKILL